MKKIQLKGNKGFVASDALIAILIITLFSGLIASVSYNIYLANSNIKRMSIANNYIFEVFEYANKIYYDEVTQQNLTNYFNNKHYYLEEKVPKQKVQAKIRETSDEILDTPFKISLDIINYNETEGNADKLDLVKQIRMTVEYVIGNKKQRIEMTTIKKRENLESPNIPNINSIELKNEEKVYPIKVTDEGFVVCNKNDNNWYDYEKGNWARVLVTKSTLKEKDKINKENISLFGNIYWWIPRYAYSGNKIAFLFGNSNKYVENTAGYNGLIEIDKTLYTIPTNFTIDNKNLDGLWTSDKNLSVYQFLNSVYQVKE